MALDVIFRVGYIMLISSIVLIVYLSLTRASPLKEAEAVHYPPCFFSALCTCSKAIPDLGIVTCRDVPLPRIPPHINSSKVYMLHLENNGLRFIEPYFFQETALYRIEISWNSLTDISAEAFFGLERSLRELDLHYNHLRSVPSRSFRYLQKLRLLDLTGNEITDITAENWRGLDDSLETLILKNNGIFSLPPKAFSILRNLQHLDLSGNSLLEIDDGLFRDGPSFVGKLNLADNMFSSFPYHQLAYLKFLRHLDLSLNHINQLHAPPNEQDSRRNVALSLDTLKLDYNQIEFLPSSVFKNFPIVNRTFFNGNPISEIQEEAFRGSKVRELFFRDCGISELSSKAFAGLENTLQHLDLEGNNLTVLPQELLEKFDELKELSVKDNFFPGFSRKEFGVSGLQYSLHRLDLSGRDNGVVSLQELRRLRNIRSLSLTRLPQPNLSPDDFLEFGIDLEDLKISDGNLKGIKNHAFKNARGLKRLDLSENSISAVESDAFAEAGHSLIHLNLAFGFSSSVSKLPHDAFKHLTSLEHLDLSNNKLKNIPDSSFHTMNRLKWLQMQDNVIETIPRGTFQGDLHPELAEIHYSFNQLSSILTHSFADLGALERLWLDDNNINKLENRAFVNLDKLKYLNLRGNKINYIFEEAFQNLPELEELDLAYNNLKEFDFGCLDQVGTLSSFSLNVSHNVMRYLHANISTFGNVRVHGMMHSNIKVLDFSYNNISYIGRWFFRQIESSVTHLHLSRNALTNLTKDVFGNMIHLQWLDLSWNNLEHIEFDSFRNSKKIQVLYLSNNLLTDIPGELFREFSNLRVVELANNRLRVLPDILFTGVPMERLDVSRNQLSRVPFSSFSADAAESLVELDVSSNFIVALHSPDAFARFRSLQWFNLANNRLVRLEDAAFSYLPRLFSLDLSHNLDIILDIRGRTFQGLEDTLEDLFLSNLSLNAVPEMHFPALKLLDLSDNGIYTIPADLSQNFSSLRRFEIGGNQLTQVPPVVNSLTHLRYLGISRNPIETINFQQGFRLRELDMRHLPLTFFEVGILGKMPALQTLRLSPCRGIREFNLPDLLQNNHALEHLHIEVFDYEGSSFGEEMEGPLPAKLRNITLTGRGLRRISDNLFQGIRNPHLNFVLRNTSIEQIPRSVFQRSRFARNVTLDLRSNHLNTLGNPSTGTLPNSPRKTFLLSLKISGNKWTCDCELGWIEGWERKKRQSFCEEHSQCFKTDDDLRTAVCHNKKKTSVIEALKSDIECGWSLAGRLRSQSLLTAVSLAVFLWVTN